MNFEFRSFSIDHIGNPYRELGFAWAEVVVSFTDKKTTAYPSIQIKVPIRYERSMTVDEVRRIAYETARAAIADTNALFTKNDLAAMQGLDDDQEDAEAAKSEGRRS